MKRQIGWKAALWLLFGTGASRKSKPVRMLLVFSLVGLSIPSAWAQLYSGSIVGVISDPTGAVVPGAKVTVTDVAKQTSISATTDSDGRYAVRSRHGHYKVHRRTNRI